MNEQLHRIKDKIVVIGQLDKTHILFGSHRHQYKNNPTISLVEIRHFEATYKVTLPTGYVEFLTEIGNGGVGPFYGLEPIDHSLYDDLDYQRPDSLLNPSKPFLHTQPWNEEFRPSVEEVVDKDEYERERTKFEEKYYSREQMNGVLAICNYGCGISLNLVVNGQEYGNIWTDDRGNDNGIYPSHELGNKDKITFLNWYELWLDNAINKIKAILQNQNIPIEDQRDKPQIKKPWWKIW